MQESNTPPESPDYRSQERCRGYERRITALEHLVSGSEHSDGLKTEFRVMDERLKRLERITWLVLAIVLGVLTTTMTKAFVRDVSSPTGTNHPHAVPVTP